MRWQVPYIKRVNIRLPKQKAIASYEVDHRHKRFEQKAAKIKWEETKGKRVVELSELREIKHQSGRRAV